MVCECDAFKYKGTGPAHNPKVPHSFVVVRVVNDTVILIPISSEQSNYDPACPIEPHEGWNPPIWKSSFAAYFHALKTSLISFNANVQDGKIIKISNPPQEIYNRLVKGICVSKNAEPWLQKAFGCQLDTKVPPKARILRAVND